MVQVFDASPTPSNASMIGQGLGLAAQRYLPDPQQLIQRNMLSEALSQLPENASYIDVLKKVGPQFMTTPGGAQLLAEMGPILQKNNAADANIKYWEAQKEAAAKASVGNPSGTISSLTGKPNTEVKPGGEDYYRNPTIPTSGESTYPKQTAGPQPRPMLTPEQKNQKRIDYNLQTAKSGAIPDPAAVEQAINAEDQAIMQYNQQIEQERQTRETTNQERTGRALTRFNNSAITPRTENDKFVFEKFANEAKDAANDNDMYEYAKAKYNRYDNARNGLIREAQIPSMPDKVWQQFMGTYKGKENVLKDLQPQLKVLKDLGLQSEAREILSNDVGLGMEDTELALYPPSKQEKISYETFPKNPDQRKESLMFTDEYLRFPGEESALRPENYMKFKDQVNDFLLKNPKANLVALRGVINQDKKYAWTDYSKVISELIDEGRFKPDPIQEEQLTPIKSPPIPGLMEMFKEFWSGTK